MSEALVVVKNEADYYRDEPRQLLKLANPDQAAAEQTEHAGTVRVPEAAIPPVEDLLRRRTMQRNMVASKRIRATEYSDESTELDILMAKAGDYQLLKAAEEISLGRAVQTGRQAAERLKQVEYITAEQREHDIALVQLGEAAKEEFLNSNLRYVLDIASRFCNTPAREKYGFADSFQDGVIGLEHAVDLFDPNRGFKFSTYATWWIKQSMHRRFQDFGTVVRVPVNVQSTLSALRKHEKAQLDDAGIMSELELNEQELADLRDIRNFLEVLPSLDQPIGEFDDETKTLGTVIATEQTTATDYDRVHDPVDTHNRLSETGLKILALVGPYMTETEHIVIAKAMTGATLESGESRPRQRLSAMLKHPYLHTKLKELCEIKETDWRDEAACKDEPQYVQAGHLTSEKQAGLEAICAGCPVRAACAHHFETAKPAKGRWIDGITYEADRRRKRQTKRAVASRRK